MGRYVIRPDVAIALARDEAVIREEHELLAPTLLRSQVLSLLYRAVRDGELSQQEGENAIGYVRRLKLRLLGDRVLQSVAWDMADQLDWPDTLDAEYVALTRLQADALVTLDERLAHAARRLVPVASIDDLT
jgi:predicted nucleic acid-binding protein